MLDNLNIVILQLKNLAASVHYYKQILELKQDQDQEFWKTFHLGNTLLGLQPWHPGTEDERPLKPGITLGFEVDNVDNRFKEFEAKGAHILVEPRDEEFIRYSEIVDPDGYILMLYKSK